MLSSNSSPINSIRRRVAPTRLIDQLEAESAISLQSRTRRSRAPRVGGGVARAPRATNGGATRSGGGRTQRVDTTRQQGRRAALRLLSREFERVGNETNERRQTIMRQLQLNPRNQNARNARAPSQSYLLRPGGIEGGLASHNRARRDTSVVTDLDSLGLFTADNVVQRLTQVFSSLELSCVRLGHTATELECLQFQAATDLAAAMHQKDTNGKGLAWNLRKNLRESYTHGVDGNGSTTKNARVFVVLTPQLNGHTTRHSEDLWYSLYHPALTHENIRTGNVPTFYRH